MPKTMRLCYPSILVFCQTRPDIPLFVFEELDTQSRFLHACTCRMTGHPPEPPRELTRFAGLEFLEYLDIRPEQLVLLGQSHSSRVAVLDEAERTPAGFLEVRNADGLVLASPERFAVVRTADCFPILLLAPGRGSLCLLHAGWRGIRDHIIRAGVSLLLELTQLGPHQLLVALGPGIRRCCYSVGADVRREFELAGLDAANDSPRGHLDLVAAILSELRSSGVERVLDSEICTSCSADLFYSFRKMRDTGRNWMIAGFRGVG